MESVTEALIQSRTGQREVADELFSRLYDELKRVAKSQLRASQGATLDTSALINETYLRVVDQDRVGWEDRTHFFAYAAKAMRHVLVDRARKRVAKKRGGGQRPLTFTERVISPDDSAEVLIELNDALEALAHDEPRMAKVVDLRFFGGLTEEEAAAALDVSPRTVRRDWFKARAFLHRQLAKRPRTAHA